MKISPNFPENDREKSVLLNSPHSISTFVTFFRCYSKNEQQYRRFQAQNSQQNRSQWKILQLNIEHLFSIFRKYENSKPKIVTF